MQHPWILGQSIPTNTDASILNKMREWNSGRIRHVQPSQPEPDDAEMEDME